jgi:ABC-2 type transport system ATP-binding protein
VFQDVTLDRDMTVWEILEFHGRLYNMPREERKKRIEELLELVQLKAKRDERTKNLSGGMKRRLEIARGLMTRPKVLFLDEPTIGLDPQTRMRMWDYIKGVNDEGTTIFLTTHYMDEADHLSTASVSLTREKLSSREHRGNSRIRWGRISFTLRRITTRPRYGSYGIFPVSVT